MCCSFEDLSLFLYSENIFGDSHFKERCFRTESQRHVSHHCRAGDSCSDRDLLVVHPQICEVKRGRSELFKIMKSSKAVQLSTIFHSNLCPYQRLDWNAADRTANPCTDIFSVFNLSAALQSTWNTLVRLQQQGQNKMHQESPPGACSSVTLSHLCCNASQTQGSFPTNRSH